MENALPSHQQNLGTLYHTANPETGADSARPGRYFRLNNCMYFWILSLFKYLVSKSAGFSPPHTLLNLMSPPGDSLLNPQKVDIYVPGLAQASAARNAFGSRCVSKNFNWEVQTHVAKHRLDP